MFKFDWDDANRRHIAAHGVSSEEAEQVIQNEPLDLEFQDENDEERLAQLGETNSGRILIVVTTLRGSSTRVVTAFDARRALRREYIEQKGSLYGRQADSS